MSDAKEYASEVSFLFIDTYGIDAADHTSIIDINKAFKAKQSPQEFVDAIGKKFGLFKLNDDL